MPLVGNVYRPDFQADQSLPQWQDMGGDQQGPDAGAMTGGFVDMLKKRMAGNQRSPLGGFSTEMPASNQGAMGHEAMHSMAPAAKGAGGGGMKSL